MTVDTVIEAVLSRDHLSSHPDAAGNAAGAGPNSAPPHLIDEQQIRRILYLGIVGSPVGESAQGRNIDTRA